MSQGACAANLPSHFANRDNITLHMQNSEDIMLQKSRQSEAPLRNSLSGKVLKKSTEHQAACGTTSSRQYSTVSGAMIIKPKQSSAATIAKNDFDSLRD